MKKHAFLTVLLLVCFAGSVAASETDVLISQLKSVDSAKRLAAAKELGERKDPRAVNPLLSVLKDDRNWDVRLAAEEALVSIGSPAVGPLLQVLTGDKNCFVRRRAVRAVKDTKDPCATEVLLDVAAKDADCCVRRFAARALADINDPKATEFLNNALQKKNFEIISGAYRYYVRKGKAGTEEVLIEAMQGCYEKKMVLDLANCGNDKLKKAADEIAQKRGYTMTAEWSGPKWGEI